MNADLFDAVKQIVAKEGEAILADSKRVSAFLSDLARDVPKPQKVAFVKCLEHKAVQVLYNTVVTERADVKQKIGKRMNEDEGLDPDLCVETLDLLEAVLFGKTTAQATVNQTPQKAPANTGSANTSTSAPPPLPKTDTAEWYVAVNGEQQGQYTKAKLGDMLKAGTITRKSLVWKNGMADWTAIEMLAELKEILAAVPPPLPGATLKEQTAAREKAQAEIEAKTGYDWLDIESDFQIEEFDNAMPRLHALAIAGHAEAQRCLGTSFLWGKGSAQDLVKAVEWFLKAADQGEPYAQYYLGSCYERSQGVARDYAKAAEWYSKAAAQGSESAQKSLDELKAAGKV